MYEDIAIALINLKRGLKDALLPMKEAAFNKDSPTDGMLASGRCQGTAYKYWLGKYLHYPFNS